VRLVNSQLSRLAPAPRASSSDASRRQDRAQRESEQPAAGSSSDSLHQKKPLRKAVFKMVVRAGLAHCVRPYGLVLKHAPSSPASRASSNQRLALHPTHYTKKNRFGKRFLKWW